MKREFRVAIVGGGIGGVTLARALHALGIGFCLFERAPAFGEIGAGVQITPNAVKVLKALGLGTELARVGFLPEAMVGRNWETATELFRTPLRSTAPDLFGAEFYHVHRADLHSILTAGVPPDAVRFGMRCVGVEAGAHGATAVFEDGTRYEADVVVGADGIHSVVRDALWGADKPRYTGHMCWRALVPVDVHPLPYVSPDASFWMGPNAHVVTYYVKGGAAVNIVAVGESAQWVEEGWTEPSTTEELLSFYAGWHENLLRLFRSTDRAQTFKWGLFDRDPMERWSVGHATLLGDAAHPMLPFLSQGAAMAIEDAYLLASAQDALHGDIPAALAAYETERRPRTSRVQLQARERGRSYHLSSPEQQRKRDLEYQQEQARNPNAVGIRAEWIYEYDAVSCTSRSQAAALA